MVEDVGGLLITSCVERMGGYGRILNGVDNREGLSCLYNHFKPTPFIQRTVTNFQLSMLDHLNTGT